MNRSFASLLALLPLIAGACMSPMRPPSLALERSLYPGLADAKPEEIAELLAQKVELEPPLTAGIAWLRESSAGSDSWGAPLTDFQRTGVLEAAIADLQKPPLASVSALPTISDGSGGSAAGSTLNGLRSAAARFQYDVAILLQTGLAESSGFNVFAIGYIGLVTVPLFPGNDFSVAASAEACAVDVRSGIMLGCGLGRASREVRFNFPWGLSSRRAQAREDCTREAVVGAAVDLRDKIAQRVR